MNTGPSIPYGEMSGNYYGQYVTQRLPPYHQPYVPRPAPPPPPPAPITYSLRIEQGPERAKLVGRDKIKDRKPIDPPPIIRCIHSDIQASYDPHLFCAVSLYDEDKDEPKQAENSSLPVLAGTTVSSAHRLKSLNNDEGTFFVFGDLAPGVQGKARLHFVMFQVEIDTREVTALASVTSERFEVSNAKDWDGVKESTVLSRTFADQGVKLRLRKESRNGRRNMPPNFPSQSLGSQAPMLLPTPSQAFGDDDDDTDSRGNKRQRVSYSGSSYPTAYPPTSYPPNSQISMSSYQTYATQDQPVYGSYGQMQPQQQSYNLPSHVGRPQPSQTPPMHYSPQTLQYGRRQPSQYYSQQSQYGGYGMSGAQQYSSPQYSQSVYAPANTSQSSQSHQQTQQYMEGQPTTPVPSNYGQTGSAPYGQTPSQYSTNLGQYLSDPTRSSAGASRTSAGIPPLQSTERDEQTQRTLPSLRYLQHGTGGQETPPLGSLPSQQQTPRGVLPSSTHSQFTPQDYSEGAQ